MEKTYSALECPYFLTSSCISLVRNYFSDFVIEITGELEKRAIKMVEQTSLPKFLDLIKLFNLDKHFSNDFMVSKANEAIGKEELNTAAKIILDRHLFNLFDILDLCSKLGSKGANNKKIVI